MEGFANNRFNDGIQMDLDVSVMKMNTYLLAYNFRILSTNNDSYSITNIDGFEFKAQLTSGFIPLAVQVYNNVCFILSLNPFTGFNEIGTFPSPDYNSTSVNHYLINGNFEFTYKPLINLQIEGNPETPLPTFDTPTIGEYVSDNYGNFNTDQLMYGVSQLSPSLIIDTHNKVEIELQRSYDNSINIIITDNVHPIRIINSLFAINPDNTYTIINRTGIKDTNLYTQVGLLNQTLLIASSNKLMNIIYGSPLTSTPIIGGLINGGQLKAGNYRYYFVYVDEDGNETSVIGTSNVCSVYFLDEANCNNTRGGLDKEVTGKANFFTLRNLDTNYNSIGIYFSYSSNDNDVIPLYYRITSNINISNDETTFTHTGFETVTDVSSINLKNIFSNISSFRSITQCQDYLFGANSNETFIDYNELRKAALEFIVSSTVNPMDCYALDNNADVEAFYNSNAIINQTEILSGTNFYNKGYHNPKNIYYSKGYIGGESYPIGVVFILPNFKESPVFPVTSFDNYDNSLDFTDVSSIIINALKNQVGNWVDSSGTINVNPDLNRFNSLGIIRFPQRNLPGHAIFAGVPPKINILGLQIQYPTTLNSYLSTNTIGCYFVRGNRKPNLITQGFTIPTYQIFKNAVAATTPEYHYSQYIFDIIYNSQTSIAYAPIIRTKVESAELKSSNIPGNWDVGKDAGLITSNYGLIATTSGGDNSISASPRVLMFTYSNDNTPSNTPDLSEYCTPANIPSSLAELRPTAIAINNFCFLSTDFLMNVDDFKIKLNKSTLSIIPIASIIGYIDVGSKYQGNTEYSVTFVDVGTNTIIPPLLTKITGWESNDPTLYLPYIADLSFVQGNILDLFNNSSFASSDFRSAFYMLANLDIPIPNYVFSVARNIYNSYIGLQINLTSEYQQNIGRYLSDIINKKNAREEGPFNADNGSHIKPVDNTTPTANGLVVNLLTGLEPATDNDSDLATIPDPPTEDFFAIIQNIYNTGGFWSTSILQGIYNNTNDIEYFEISQKNYWNNSIADKYNTSNANILIYDDSITYNLINLYEGDCYINSYEHQLYKNGFPITYSGNIANSPLGKYIQIITESIYNTAMRNNSITDDITISSNFAPFSSGNYDYISNIVKFGSALNGTNSKDIAESNYTNKGLSYIEYLNDLFIYPINAPYLLTRFPNRVQFSLKNVYNQYINNYKIFLSTNYHDYPNKYGEIVHIDNFNESLIVFMEHAIGKIAVNERVETGSDNSGKVFILPDEVLSPIMNIISYNFGTRWQSSIVRSDNYFYCVDVDACKILQISNEGTRIISDFVIQSFLKQYLTTLQNDLIDISTLNVTGHYDRNYNEIRFNCYNLNDNSVNFNIIYNENLKIFTSFYSYNSNISFNLYNKHYSLSATNKSTQDSYIYEHNVRFISNVINKNKFYGISVQSSVIKFVVNDKYDLEKVFDNLQIVSNNILPDTITYYIQGANTTQTIILRNGNNIMNANAVYREEKGYVQIPRVENITNKDIYNQLTDIQSNVKAILGTKSRFKGKAVVIEFTYNTGEEMRLNGVITQYRDSNS